MFVVVRTLRLMFDIMKHHSCKLTDRLQSTLGSDSDGVISGKEYGYWSYGVFEKLGIPGPKPVMYFGSVCSTYELKKPLLVVMDPDILKIIMVKECFTYFTNRRNFRLNGDLYDALSVSEDDNWRRIRNIVTPSFTTGRIKEMFHIMKHHSRKLTDKLQSTLGSDSDAVITVKEFFGPYSMDVMGSCALSVDMDSINNPSSPLLTHGSQLLKFSIPLFLFQGCFPIVVPLLELLGVSLFPRTSTNYFKMLMEKVRAEREGSSHQHSEDLLQHMMSFQTVTDPRKETQKKGLTDHEVISQVAMFLFAGYETSALTLVSLAYTLARNPEVMKRLQKEIDSTFPNKALPSGCSY
ncbi:hypothetical protein INR49_003942 [Caranx melampygus]|nr:hypothetical protein INR49_003942 [Caranx melampygus]